MTFEEVRNDLRSTVLCSFFVETPKLGEGWSDIQVWIDPEHRLWIWYSTIGAELVCDCSTYTDSHIVKSISDAYANGLGKCAPILYGTDSLAITIVRHRYTLELPGEIWVTNLRSYEQVDLSAGSGNI